MLKNLEREKAERVPPKMAGLRERKKQETRDFIAKVGMRLFITQGYEATTLDAISKAAGISRRTFFYYFKSKDDILSTFQNSLSDRMILTLRQEPPGQEPIDAMRQVLLKLATEKNQTRDRTEIDRVVNSNEMLLARSQAGFVRMERVLFATLCEIWPQAERQTALRIVAMASIGIMRLAIETRTAEGGTRPMIDLVEELFAALKAEILTRIG